LGKRKKKVFMASDADFMNYVVEQIEGIGEIRTKKMFGEYCIYLNDKPVLWIADNVVMVKKLDCVKEYLSREEISFLYPGSKEFYVLDVDDSDELKNVALALEKVIPVPKKKKRK
jgi:TfoX/Sxy family transcriptional regulator of competence genes